MLSLFAVTLAASALDSLNPVIITQQFVLQGMVSNKRHIWAYILAVFLTYFSGGLLVYFGAATLFQRFFAGFLEKHFLLLMAAELLLGAALILLTVRFFLQSRISTQSCEAVRASDNPAQQPRSVRPAALFFLGAAATFFELPTALPYFAFLTALLSRQLPAWNVLILLTLYNLVFIFPPVLLYQLYVRCQNRFDVLYRWFENRLRRLLKVLMPLFTGGVGAFLVCHALLALR